MLLRICDFETCGFPPDDCQIVEAATVDLVGHDDGAGGFEWTRGRMWQSLVNPGREIPALASAVHHITDDMVKDAPTIEQVMPTIISGPGAEGTEYHVGTPDHFAAHNAKFEIACASWLPVPMLCSYKCAVAAWPDAPAFGNQVLRYFLKIKLAEEAGPPHRAQGDAYITAAIFRRLLHAGNSVSDMLAVSNMPVLLPRLTFGEHAMKPASEVPESYWTWIVHKSKGPWDEDVLFTANHYLEKKRATQRSRSPV